MHRHPSSLAISTLALAFITGCKPADTGPPLAPVAGVVTYDGQPLEAALVTLSPLGETPGQAGMGRTDVEGKFKILSIAGQGEGVVAGTHRVLVSKLVNPDGSLFVPKPGEGPMDGTGREMLPAVYSDPSQARLQATIPPEGQQNLELKLQSKP